MKKAIKIAAISFGILLLLWVIARATNSLQWFRTANTANLPAWKLDEWFFTSRFVTPERLDFICFEHTTPEWGRHIRTYRLCGLPGDTVSIRAGNLYVNNMDLDAELNLNLQYFIAAKDVIHLQEENLVRPEEVSIISPDSAIVMLDRKTLEAKNIRAGRRIREQNEPDEFIKARYGRDWNADHFGPVVVPEGKYFVLGDNRYGAEDSRYMGFVNKSDVVGTVLSKK